MLCQLGYVSTAVAAIERADLIDILRAARASNHDNDVTGLLLYYGGHFLQVLEGTEAVVRETFARICKDARHRNVTALFEEPIEARTFSDWTMGFQLLDGNELLEFPDADGHPRDLRSMTQDASRAKRLLLTLRQRGLDPDKDIATT